MFHYLSKATHGLPYVLLAIAAACGDTASEPSATTDEAAVASPSPSTASARTRAGTTGTVTLITGDRVTLRQDGDHLVPEVHPGPGRANVAFLTERNGDQVTVIPSDVHPLLVADRLDRELFNVTRLLREGLGDDKRGDLPLLVTGQADVPALHRRMATASGVTIDHALPTLHALGVRQRKASGGAVLASLAGVAPAGLTSAAIASTAAQRGPKIWLDRRRKLTLDHSVPQIGAPAAYARGFTGAGVAIAVLDTGIDVSHPDFAGKVTAAEDFVGDGNGTTDKFGHGTHVASILAGSGAASGGQFHGVATGASLLNGRVCDVNGDCPDSAILAGMEWAAATQHAHIVNMSLGGDDLPGIDPLEDAVNTLSAQFGTLFVISAGNAGGAGQQTISSPGSADAALTVGAIDRNDQLAFFSSQGPRIADHAIKPDITGPGVSITAARATGTALGPLVGDAYVQLSGTSMAAPHVAGAAAILLQQHPTWTGTQLKDALINTAQPNAALTVYQQGAGRVDVDRATRHAVSTEPASESFGVIPFPHDHDAPRVRTVTYHNDGSAPVTLELAARLTGPDGTATPGMITVAPASLTIAAGSTADATLTVDTSLAGEATGFFSGNVIATGDDLRIVTPVGVDREAQSFNLTVDPIGVDGTAKPVSVMIIGVAPFDSPIRRVTADRDTEGPTTFRLPAGTYYVRVIDLDSVPGMALIAPRVDLTSHDTTVRMDGQLGKPLDLTLPVGDLSLFFEQWDFVDGENVFESGVGSLTPLFTAQVGPGPAPGTSYSSVQATYVSSREAASEVYNVAHQEKDHFLSGWKALIPAGQLTTINAGHAGRDDRTYIKDTAAMCPRPCSVIQLGPSYVGPATYTEHYFADRGYVWDNELLELVATEGGGFLHTSTISEIRDLVRGQIFDERWNEAVLGPVWPGPNFFGLLNDRTSAPIRTQGFFLLQPAMFSDLAAPPRESDTNQGTGRLRLFENGALIDEDIESFFIPALFTEVDDADADFRLEADYDRPSDLFDLSTHVIANWTFHSAPKANGRDEDLSLPVVRFKPVLDDHNTTAAAVMPLHLQIERPLEVPTPPIKSVTLDVSFDDGATWQPVSVARTSGDLAQAMIVHPPGARFVSLHATARDTRGNAVDQTIIHAYKLAQ